MAVISYDEKPGIQAIATTAPDLPPEPGVHATFAASTNTSATAQSVCWPGSICLRQGPRVGQGSPPQPRVHRVPQASRRRLSGRTAIKLILDNHSAHISKETKAWLADQPAHRFEFVFTPKHGSWLNLIEGFFSKLARSVLRHIRVASKQELKDRLMAAMDHFNHDPVVHTWTYKLDKAA